MQGHVNNATQERAGKSSHHTAKGRKGLPRLVIALTGMTR